MESLILVGGGLANSLIALFLARANPSVRPLIVERSRRLGGEHTWSFHHDDVSADARKLLEPLLLNITLYLRNDVIHVNLVVATALMAIARKVIVFDYKVLDPQYIWATGGVVFALGVTYWLLLRRDREATQT